MIRFALYARVLDELEQRTMNEFIHLLDTEEDEFLIYDKLGKEINGFESAPNFAGYYDSGEDLKEKNATFLISFGGDGTLLDTVLFIRKFSIPVIGINTGRLGFLSHVQPAEMKDCLEALRKSRYELEERSILSVRTTQEGYKQSAYALNEISVHKRDTSSMITIQTYLDGDFFNSYWADGLLISTPTGSTAYNLSCGGPIVMPTTPAHVICPVAPHNLNVRPIIVSDRSVITLKVKGRGSNYLLSLDSRNAIIDYKSEVSIKKASFKLPLVQFDGENFVSTLREKLNWGKDHRNLDP